MNPTSSPSQILTTGRIWQPLDPAKKQIRLLSLSADDNIEDSPVLQVEIVSLYDTPDYDAISYAWGEAGDIRPVFVNGERRSTTSTLERCLRCLRRVIPGRKLWCDFLSINQQDAAEKSAQIEIMHEIFANAAAVRVWLYPRARVELMLSVAKQINRVGETGRYEGIIVDGRELDAENCHSLAVFCCDAWWTRLWVIQEFALARKVFFHFDSVVVDYEHFYFFAKETKTAARRMDLTSSYGRNGLSFYDLSAKYRELYVLRNTFSPAAFQSLNISLSERLTGLVYTMGISRERLVTEPKDRIFGLLALCAKTFGYAVLKADYAANMNQVCTEFALGFIRASGSLLILSQSGSTHNKLTALSTWVPDWTSPYSFLPETERILINRRFRACGTIPLTLRAEGDGTLGLSYYFIDVVQHVGSICEETSNLVFYNNASSCLVNWQELVSGEVENSPDPSVYGENVWDAYYRTVCNDSIWDSVSQTANPCGPNASNIYKDAKWRFESGHEGDSSGSLLRTISKRRFIVSQQSKYFGLAPADTRENDHICLLAGGNVPFILRLQGASKPRRYTLVGDCYVQGVMQGELFTRPDPIWFEDILLE